MANVTGSRDAPQKSGPPGRTEEPLRGGVFAQPRTRDERITTASCVNRMNTRSDRMLVLPGLDAD